MRKFLLVLVGVFVVVGAFAAADNIPTSKTYVDTAIAQKQDTITANDGAAQVLTNTGTAGEYGTQGIYDATGEYAPQTQNLVDAATMNAGVQNAIDSEFQCIEWDDHGECLLMDVFGPSPSQIIPREYTQLEYLESTGTQWIDTGIKPLPNIGVIAKYSYSRLTAYAHIFGTFEPHFYLGITSSGQDMSMSYGPTANNVVISMPIANVVINKPYTARLNYLNDGIAEFVGISSTNIPPKTFPNNNSRIRLFANAALSIGSWSRIYNIKITENTSIVRDFIPARRNSDGVLGMYDTVTNTFFTNAGTGEFIAGPIVYLPTGQ